MPEAKSNNHSTSSLFTPVHLGAIALGHRVVMAPLTRSRAEQPGEVPGSLMAEYYGQRASQGGLIISEATTISKTARGWYGAPGMYADQQVEGWRKVLDTVHARGGKMVSQLWHTGRSSHVSMTGGPLPVSASVNPGYWPDKSHLVSTPTGWSIASPHRASRFLKFVRSSMITATLPFARKRLALMASNSTPPMAICRTSSCKTVATSVLTPTVVQLKTDHVFCWKSWRLWRQCGEATALPYGSRQVAHGTACRIATPARCSVMSPSS